jgi:hypothetical protein
VQRESRLLDVITNLIVLNEAWWRASVTVKVTWNVPDTEGTPLT